MQSETSRRSISAQEIAEGLGNYSTAGEGYVAPCPVHDDDVASLSIRDGEKAPLIKCHAGCDRTDIIKELSARGLWYDSGKTRPETQRHTPQKQPTPKPEPEEKPEPKPKVKPKYIHSYDYTDENGTIIHRTHRYHPKSFKQSMIDPETGKEVWSLKTLKELYPYRLPEFYMEKRKDHLGHDRPVVIFEGEKDADLACDMGILGTTLPMGAGKWREEFLQWFSGRRVYIIRDDDNAGKDHAQTIAEALQHVCPQMVKVVALPNPDGKKGYDFSDYIADGGTKELLQDLIQNAPYWTVDTLVDETKSVGSEVVDIKSGKPTHNAKPLKGSPSDIWAMALQAMITKSDGEIDQRSTHNAGQFLRFHPDMQNKLGWNQRRNLPYMLSPFPWDTGREGNERPLNNYDAISAVQWLENHGIKLPPNQANVLLEQIAYLHPYDRLAEYLTELVWDGKPRLRRMFETYFGANDDGLTMVISEKFMKGSVARALRPGCQMDNMLVLEGVQGIKKSTGLAALFGAENYCDQLPPLSKHADAAMQLSGNWCVEVQEFNTMNQADYNRIKEFLSVKEDTFRPPYGRHVIRIPRGCVIVGTINPEGGYLKDPTGARRFWPVTVSGVNIEAIVRDRDQLWAEAVHLYHKNPHWWFDIESEENQAMRDEQQERYAFDAWAEDIARFALEQRSGFTISDVCSQALGMEKWQITPQVQKRVRNTLNALDFKQGRSGGRRVYKREPKT